MGIIGMETIIVVHGTFAREGQWWQPGGDFCKKLDQQLETKNHPARCWEHLKLEKQIKGEMFSWSGDNSQISRMYAASKLQSYLSDLMSQWEKSSHHSEERYHNLAIHLVGHSHGGNVILDALTGLGSSIMGVDHSYNESFPEDVYPIKSVTLLGTPYLKTKNRTSDKWNWLLALALASIYLVTALGILSWFVFLVWRFLNPDSLPVSFDNLNMMVLVAILSSMVLSAFLYFNLSLYDGKMETYVDYRVNFINSKYDEAISLLKLAVQTKKDSKGLSQKYTRLDWNPPFSTSYMPLKRYKESLANNFNNFSLPRTVFRLPFIIILGFPFAFFLFFDYTILRILSLSKSLITRWGLHSGIKTIAQKVLGDDNNLTPIVDVLDAPSEDAVSELHQLKLAQAIEDELLSDAKDEVKSSTHSIYTTLSELNHVNVNVNTFENLHDIYDSKNSVHCKYYHNTQIISMVCDAIRKT